MAKKPRSGGEKQTGDDSGKSRGSKSDAIRDYLKAHKGAMPKQVVAALKTKGIDVSPNMVSVIRAKAGVKKAGRKAKQAVADHSSSADLMVNRAAALEAALVLYKAAQGMETPSRRTRDAFLLLVSTLG